MNDVYQQIIDAGVRAELLLRKVNEFEEIEFIEEDEQGEEEDIPQLVGMNKKSKRKQNKNKLLLQTLSLSLLMMHLMHHHKINNHI